MDTSVIEDVRVLTRLEIDRIYGSYESVVVAEPSISSHTLIARQHVCWLSEKQLVELMEKEYVDVFWFTILSGVQKVKISLMCEEGFAFNTPSYILTPYARKVSDEKQRAKLGYSDDQSIAEVSKNMSVEYVLVSRANNGYSRISFVTLTLLLHDDGTLQKSARQYVPDEVQYYKVLSDIHLWISMRNDIVELYRENMNHATVRLRNLTGSQSDFRYFTGRIDEAVGCRR